MEPDRHPTLQALGLRDVQFYVGARFFGSAAQSMLHAALAWHVFDVTGSAFWLGIVGVVEFLPVLPVSLLGGAIADARERRSVVMWARFAGMLGALALAGVASGGSGAGESTRELEWLLACAFALAVGRGFENPAGAAMLPALVPREIYPSATVVGSSVRNLGLVSGPVAAGFAIAADGPSAAYTLAAGAYSLAIGLLLGVRRVHPEVAGGRVSLDAVREGVLFVWRRTAILGAMTLDMFAVIFASVTALLPVFAEDILGVGPRGYGLLSGAMSIGTFSMTLVLLVRQPFLRPGRALLIAVLFFGLATLVFALSRSFALSMLALVAAGMADQVSMVTRATIINLSTPDELRGRVNAVNMVFIGASNELGAAESGFLAALTTPVFSALAGAVACLAAVGIVAARVPALRHWHFKEPDQPEEP